MVRGARPQPVHRHQHAPAALDPAPRGPGHRADLARHSAQADRPRHRQRPVRRPQVPVEGRGGDAELELPRVAEPVLDADHEAGVPVRRRDPGVRLPAQRRPPLREDGGRGAHRAQAHRPAGGQEGRAVRADLAGRPVLPGGQLQVRSAARREGGGGAPRRRPRPPHPQALEHRRRGARRRRRLRLRRVQLPGHRRAVPDHRRAGHGLLVAHVRLREHGPSDAVLHVRPGVLPRPAAWLLLRLREAGPRPAPADFGRTHRRARRHRGDQRLVRGRLSRIQGRVLRPRRRACRRAGDHPDAGARAPRPPPLEPAEQR